MPSRLSSDVFDQLTPLLGSLARLVARSAQVSEAQLHTLLLGADLESEPAALEEIKRWLRLLTALRAQPTEENRHATAEALMLRGLSEAPVFLAIATVADQPGGAAPPLGPTPTRRLTASVASLDLGTLPAGKPAAGEFQVQGGPGQILVESDQVRVTPLQFAVGTTTVRVEAKALSDGVLWTTLRLVTAGETLDVPVLAQWQDGARHVPGTTPGGRSDLVVALDGSGDFRSLSEAVEKAEAGATLRLKTGVHRLDRSLEIGKGLSLIGEGMETTRIVCAAAGTVIRYTGDRTFSASDLAFVREGLNWGDVFSAGQGEVSLQRCRFTGGVWDKTSQRGGDGLWLYGTVRGQVKSCHATGNEMMGIRVGGQAQPTLEGNTCQGNKSTGIAYFGTAAGAARQNTCSNNERNGITILEQAQPTLEANTCQGNKSTGIAYSGTAAGAARQNTCSGNEKDGIFVGEQAQPTLEGNTCQGNKWSGIGVSGQAKPVLIKNICQQNSQRGIVYWGTAAGTARQNTCSNNEQIGITVLEQAQPTLEANTCQGNKSTGIAYSGTAAGTARQNTCSGNENHGIFVGEQAQPTLEANTCQGNKVDGISYRDTSSGTARANECVGNGDDGIYVAATARPTLRDNRCRSNEGRDVNDQRQ